MRHGPARYGAERRLAAVLAIRPGHDRLSAVAGSLTEPSPEVPFAAALCDGAHAGTLTIANRGESTRSDVLFHTNSRMLRLISVSLWALVLVFLHTVGEAPAQRPPYEVY